MGEWLRTDLLNEPASHADDGEAVLLNAESFVRAIDSVIARLAMTRLRLTLYKIQFQNLPAHMAHNVAVAVCGASGILGCVAPNLFFILDLGPRPAGGSAAGVQRLGLGIQRLTAAAPSLRSSEARISELSFASDEGRLGAQLLAELNERRPSTVLLSGRPLPAAVSTAAEPARRPRLPPGPAGGFASASVIPLQRAAYAASSEG